MENLLCNGKVLPYFGRVEFEGGPGLPRWKLAAMGQMETKVADWCSHLNITRQTLYRHVAPDGTLRKDGLKMVEGGQTRNRHGKKH